MAFVVALVVALVATPLLARVATRLAIVDQPGPLKPQARAVPYLGGVAVFAALAGPVAVDRPVLLVPLGLALLAGLVDDLRPRSVGLPAGVPARRRASRRRRRCPRPGHWAGSSPAFLALGLLNAVNLLDGMDGVAAGCGLVSALGLAVLDGGARVPALGAGRAGSPGSWCTTGRRRGSTSAMPGPTSSASRWPPPPW